MPLGQAGRSCLQSASTLLNCCGQPVGGALSLPPLDLQQIRTKSSCRSSCCWPPGEATKGQLVGAHCVSNAPDHKLFLHHFQSIQVLHQCQTILQYTCVSTVPASHLLLSLRMSSMTQGLKFLTFLKFLKFLKFSKSFYSSLSCLKF